MTISNEMHFFRSVPTDDVSVHSLTFLIRAVIIENKTIVYLKIRAFN